MTSYQQEQHKLFRELEKKFKRGEAPSSIVDPVKDYENDNRICLTGAAFMPKNIQKIISEQVIELLKRADKKQYYYLPNSLHLTIQSVRTIHDPPLFTGEDIEKVKRVFGEVIPKHKKLVFQLKGLFKLPTSLSICGYSTEVLKYLVQELREKLDQIGVPDNKTYASGKVFFGNVNVCRYTTKPNEDFIKKVEKLKNINIGSLEAKTVSLITTNCVCHPSKTKIIGTYNLV